MSAGVLVTAAHVLADVGADKIGAQVAIEPLGGGISRMAIVEAIDLWTDLAVLGTVEPLGASVAGLVATHAVTAGTQVVITGVADVPDPTHTFDFLDATGTWAGAARRDGHLPLGRLESKAVMRGMSGAPVRRRSDDRVVGVVSARYNSADGWGRDSVWVARSEDLKALRARMAPPKRRRRFVFTLCLVVPLVAAVGVIWRATTCCPSRSASTVIDRPTATMIEPRVDDSGDLTLGWGDIVQVQVSDLPAGESVWFVVYSYGPKLYQPDPAPEPGNSRRWIGPVYPGERGSNGPYYDLLVVRANAQGNETFQAYVTDPARKQGYHPGFAALPPGVTEIKRFPVTRRAAS